MSNRARLFCQILAALAACWPGMATSALVEPAAWSDQAEVSFVDSRGNSEVTTLAAKNTLKLPLSAHLLGTWKLKVLYGETDGVTSAESYASELRCDYQPARHLYYFGSGHWLKDRFSGIDNRYTLGAGVGYKFLAGSAHFLAGEAGLIYTVEETIRAGNDGYLGGRLFGEYEYRINKQTSFSQSLEYLPNFDHPDDWRLNSETALKTALNSYLSLKTSYLVNYDNYTPDASEHADRVLSVTLVVNF